MAFSRKLQQRSVKEQDQAEIYIVNESGDFSAGIRLGARHIEVRSHLDFSIFSSVVKELLWQPVPLSDTLTLRV